MAFKFLDRCYNDAIVLNIDQDNLNTYVKNDIWKELFAYVENGGSLILLNTGSQNISFSMFVNQTVGLDDTWKIDHTKNISSNSSTIEIIKLERGLVVYIGSDNSLDVIDKNRTEYFSNLFVGVINNTKSTTSNLPEINNSLSDPQHIKIKIFQPVNGLLFKESFFEKWNAYVIDSSENRRELSIFHAGPDFMYVFLPKNTEVKYPITLSFEYKITSIELISYIISIFTAFCFILFIINKKIKIM